EVLLQRFCWPDVVAIEGDVLPSEGRDSREQKVTDRLSVGAQLIDGAGQIDRVPESDGRDDEIKARGPVLLVLEGSVADFAEPVKEQPRGPGRFVLLLC